MRKSIANVACKRYPVIIWLEISFFNFHIPHSDLLYREFPAERRNAHVPCTIDIISMPVSSLHLISHFCFFDFRKFPKVSLVGRAREQRAKINFTPGMGKWGKWIDKGVSPTSGWLPKRECDHDGGERGPATRGAEGRRKSRKGRQNGNGVRRR